MISAFTNTFKIPELRNRVLFTLIMLVIVRIGAAITCPGVNAMVLRQWFLSQVNQQTGGGAAALFNLFSGGALENCAVFSLGVMPYISASIMLQLLTAVIPQLGKLAKEDGGRQKIMQYTRYATIALCLFQGYLLALSFENPMQNPFLPGIRKRFRPSASRWLAMTFEGLRSGSSTVITLTAGTMLLMWLGDQITDRGIGNGMSLIITVGIVARLPAALIQAWRTFVPSGGQVEPGEPDGAGADDRISVDRDRRGDLRDAGPAQNQRAIRQACCRPKSVRRPDAIHAAQGQLCGRHADHLCAGTPHFPEHDCQHGVQELAHGPNDRGNAQRRMAPLHHLRSDDFLLQLFLGRHAIPAAVRSRTT